MARRSNEVGNRLLSFLWGVIIFLVFLVIALDF